MTAGSGVVLLGLFAAGGIGCASFSTVRSAEVTPGSTVVMQANVASPPGEDAAWFYVIECAVYCNQALFGGELQYAHAVGSGWRRPVLLGGGLNGVFPFLEGYVQLDTSRTRPYGVGARVGLPVWSWNQHQIYARVDFPWSESTRVLWNPGIVLHTGQSPNGENPGSLLGVVQGVGVQHGAGSTVLTPSLAVVIARATHRSAGRQYGPTTSVFVNAGMSVTFRKPR